MPCWLMKSEPDDASIDDLARAGRLPWAGVRNYQARNFMRDAMTLGDEALFYHSGCAQPGIAGICKVASAAHVDETQFDPASPYFDPTSTREAPRWVCVDVEFVLKSRFIPLSELRAEPALADMRVLARGNRLSITPVTADEWRHITQHLMQRKD